MHDNHDNVGSATAEALSKHVWAEIDLVYDFPNSGKGFFPNLVRIIQAPGNSRDRNSSELGYLEHGWVCHFLNLRALLGSRSRHSDLALRRESISIPVVVVAVEVGESASSISRVCGMGGKQHHRFSSFPQTGVSAVCIGQLALSGRDLHSRICPVLLELHRANMVQRRVHSCSVIPEQPRSASEHAGEISSPRSDPRFLFDGTAWNRLKC
jgi:hypothetical protein